MKLTKSRLKRLIKEELQKVLMNENPQDCAQKMMYRLCQLGWTINNPKALWTMAGGKRCLKRDTEEMAWDIAEQAAEWERKHGAKDVLKTFGLRRSNMSQSQCTEHAKPRRG